MKKLNNQIHHHATFMKRVMLLLLGLFPQSLAAQEPRYRAELFDTRRGLSSPSIRVIFCDSRNFIWLATDNGVFRFDGYRFENLSAKLRLSSSEVLNFTENPIDSSVWMVGWQERIHIWRISTSDQLEVIDPPEKPFGPFAHRLHFCPDGHLWYAGGNGIWYFTPQEVLAIQSKKLLPTQVRPAVFSEIGKFVLLPITGDGTPNGIFFGFTNRVFHATANGQAAQQIGAAPPENFVTSLLAHPSKPGVVLAGLKSPINGFGVFSLSREKALTPFCAGDEWVRSIFSSPDGKKVIFSDANCLSIADAETGEFLDNYPIWGTLPIGFLMGMTPDHYGNFWFGTNAGLAHLRKEPMRFGYFPKMTKAKAWQNGIYALAESPVGEFLVGVNSGQVFIRVAQDSFAIKKLPLNGIITHEVHDLHFDRKGHLWMFNNWQGVQRLRNGQFDNFGETAGIPIPHDLSTSLLDSKGRLWVGSGLGGAFLDAVATAPATAHFLHIQGQRAGLPERSAVSCFTEYPPGKIWAGTSKGLFCFNNQLGIFYRIASDTFKINDLWFSPQGKCWMAVAGLGIVCYSFDTKGIVLNRKVYSDPVWHSLQNPKNLEPDDDGNLWVASAVGVTVLRIRPDGQREVLFFDNRDGLLPGNSENTKLFFLRDTMWCASLQGLMYFLPRSLQQSKQTQAQFRSIRVNGNLLERNVCEFATDWHATVELEFTAINPPNASKVRYEVSLSSPESDTTWVGEERELVLPQLGAGNYKLLLRACNTDGVWQIVPTEMRFCVMSFWVSPRVMGVAGVALLSLFLLWLLLQIRRERERRKEAEKLAAKERETNDLHKELHQTRIRHTEVFDLSHRQNMSSHILQHLWHNAYALNCAGEHEATREYLLRLRQFYGLATEIGKNLFVTLQTEKRFLEEYLRLEESRLPQLTGSVELVAEQPNGDLDENPWCLKIPAFMLQTIVENAIRYAFNGKTDHWRISVQFRSDPVAQTISCVVEDNGIGIKAVQANASNPWKSTSYGLDSIDKRLENFNKSLAEKEKDQGSTPTPEAFLKIEPAFMDNPSFPGTRITITLPDSLDTWAVEYFKS